MWIALFVAGARNERHVIPVSDLREHIEATTCWCRPMIEDPNEEIPLVVHHSLDGRELAEPNCNPKFQEVAQ